MIWDAFNIYMACLLGVIVIGGLLLTWVIGREYAKFIETVRQMRR